MTDSELIEAFWIEQGGKAHLPPDIYFYESDWNMLMPVVEKIEAEHMNDVVIFKEATQIRVWQGDKETFSWKVLEPDGSSKIAHVYRAVVKYIRHIKELN